MARTSHPTPTTPDHPSALNTATHLLPSLFRNPDDPTHAPLLTELAPLLRAFSAAEQAQNEALYELTRGLVVLQCALYRGGFARDVREELGELLEGFEGIVGEVRRGRRGLGGKEEEEGDEGEGELESVEEVVRRAVMDGVREVRHCGPGKG